jgi:hypothetical protein
MTEEERKVMRAALKAFRRIKSQTSEEHDFRPTEEGAIRRIAAEQIVRLEEAGADERK